MSAGAQAERWHDEGNNSVNTLQMGRHSRKRSKKSKTFNSVQCNFKLIVLIKFFFQFNGTAETSADASSSILTRMQTEGRLT